MAALTAALLTIAAADTLLNVSNDRKQAKGARALGNANAAIADQQAQDALARGDEAVGQVGAQERGLTGSQDASFAGQGLDSSSGSAADVIASDQKLSELDKLTIKRNAQREAHGYQLQATAYRKGGQLAGANYNNQAIGTLLNGAGNMLGIYQSFGMNSTPRKPSASSGGSGPSSTNGGYNNGTARP